MGIDASSIKRLIDDELEALRDNRVRTHIRKFLIEPEPVYLNWDYGAEGQKYLCWIVFKDEKHGTGIAYSEFGFGPSTPWGLVWLREEASMGMDSGWYFTFVRAYFESFTAADLPIWRIFSGGWPGEANYQAISPESSCNETWDAILELRTSKPDVRFFCDTDESARLCFQRKSE